MKTYKDKRKTMRRIWLVDEFVFVHIRDTKAGRKLAKAWAHWMIRLRSADGS